ncbi:unnamed protein product [Merluccius merluccius]
MASYSARIGLRFLQRQVSWRSALHATSLDVLKYDIRGVGGHLGRQRTSESPPRGGRRPPGERRGDALETRWRYAGDTLEIRWGMRSRRRIGILHRSAA